MTQQNDEQHPKITIVNNVFNTFNFKSKYTPGAEVTIKCLDGKTVGVIGINRQLKSSLTLLMNNIFQTEQIIILLIGIQAVEKLHYYVFTQGV